MDSTRLEPAPLSPMPAAASPVAGHPPTNEDIEAVIQMATSARPSPDGRGPLKDTRTQLFVGNLPYRVRWQDLKDLFRQAGTVLRADVSLGPDNRSRGYGTVLLASAEDAGRAIDKFNGFSWQTRVLEVRPDRIPPDFEGGSVNGLSLPDIDGLSLNDRPKSASGTNGRHLYVGNLPFHCQWQDLKDLFRQAGTIVRADVALGADGRSRGHGTVVFATDYDADRAVKMFNGYEYNGRALKVHPDKFQPGTQPQSPSLSTFSAMGSPFPNTGAHPGSIRLPSGFAFDWSAPSTPYDMYQPHMQMQMPHPIHQPNPIAPPMLSSIQSNSNENYKLSTSPSGAPSTGTTPPGADLSPRTQNAQSQQSSLQNHPHHPGQIALPPPSFAMHPGMHQLSPGLISPMYHPMSPMHHPGVIPMTPHGLPPITPSMPPFTFLPSFGPMKTNEGEQMPMNGYPHNHYPTTSSSLAQTVPMTPTPPSPPDGNPLERAGSQPSSSSSASIASKPAKEQQHQKQQMPPRHPHMPAAQLTPFSPGVAMSPGPAIWARNPYLNPAPGAPVHPYPGSPVMFPIPSPGMYPIPSPGGFIHPHPSPGGFFYPIATEPKGYFDSVMAMNGQQPPQAQTMAAPESYFALGPTGVEDEIMKKKQEEEAKSAGVTPKDERGNGVAADGQPARTHSFGETDKRPRMPRGADSDPLGRSISKSVSQSPNEL